MSESEMEKSGLSASQTAAQSAVRVLPMPQARPEFRERLRRQFAQGEIPSGTRPPAKIWRWTLPLAAAAAFIMAIFLNRGPEWALAGVRGSGVVLVDGVAVPTDDASKISSMLHPGAVLATQGDAGISLLLERTLFLEVTPGSQIVLPQVPGRWWGRHAESRIDSGELRVTTGPDFPGATLRIDAGESAAEVTGTTFAVIRSESEVCICSLEGVVRMVERGGLRTPVIAGTRRAVSRLGAPTRLEDILPMERMKLSMLKDLGATLLEKE